MRRDFLKQCALAGLGLAVPLRFPPPTRAESRDDGHPGPYYVVLNASGGWDTTYLMDPKGIGGINRLYRDGDIATRGAHAFAPDGRRRIRRVPGSGNVVSTQEIDRNFCDVQCDVRRAAHGAAT